MSARDKPVQGACLCGSVAFHIKGPMRDVIACHCVECRRQSGHYWAATSVAERDLEMVRQEGLRWYNASESVTRGFCELCGSTLFYVPDGEARVVVSAGALKPGTGLRLTKHVFVAEQGDYYSIGDHLPVFEGFSGAEHA
ncbi:MAG: GFA family protein [Pseudomonadota bacterium]